MTELQAAELLIKADILIWYVVFGIGLFFGVVLFYVCIGTASRSLYSW